MQLGKIYIYGKDYNINLRLHLLYNQENITLIYIISKLYKEFNYNLISIPKF